MKEIEKTRKAWILVSCALTVCCILLLFPCIQHLVYQMIGVLFHGESRATRLEKVFSQLSIIGLGGVITCLAFAFILFIRIDERVCAFLSVDQGGGCSFKSNAGKVEIVLIALYSAFVLFLCFFKDKSIWADEAFTVSLCSHSFPEIISLTAQDVHPPLYYLIVKSLAIIFRGSWVSMRIASTLSIILFMIIGFMFLSKEISLKAGILFSLFVFSSEKFMRYNCELRMYSWAAFFCGLLGIFAYYVIKRGKVSDWIFLVLSAVCAAYTHYFAAILALFVFIPLCVYKFFVSKTSRKFVIISCILGTLLYFPWIPIVIRQVSSKVSQGNLIYHLDLITFTYFFMYISPGAGLFGVFGLIFMVAFLVFFLFGMKKNFWLSLCVFSPLALIFAYIFASVLGHPISAGRYVVPCFFLTALATAVILNSIKNTKIITAIIIILLLSSVTSVVPLYKRTEISSRKYREFIEAVEPKIERNTKFVFMETEKVHFSSHQGSIWATYFPGHEIYSSSPSQWGYLFNSKFLPLESLSFDSPLCVIAFDGTLDSEHEEDFIASLVGDSGWIKRDYILVSPDCDHDPEYRVFFFSPNEF